MRKWRIPGVLAALALALVSCGTPTSKQFKAIEEEVKSIEAQINEIGDCDELQMLNFGILGLRSDMDNYRTGTEMTGSEVMRLDEMIDRLEATWNGKWAALGCEQQLSPGGLDTAGEESLNP